MTFQLSDATRAVLDELERMRLSEERANCYTQIARVSGESDNLRSGSGLVLTPQAGAAPRHEGKT